MTRIFDTLPDDWQSLEIMVRQTFEEMGYESHRAYKLETVRGVVEIDVFARKTSSPIPTIVLCECKHWNKAVPQNVVQGFRTICADSGAHFGIIISKEGFQSGAEISRDSTNVHLMDFSEFQETFFPEWKKGAFTLMVRMHDQLLPILRASAGIHENGTDTIGAAAISGIDVFRKYSMFFGLDGGYASYFIMNESFPATFPDPRGDPHEIESVTVHSHREYLELAREALVECMRRFALRPVYFTNTGEVLRDDVRPT